MKVKADICGLLGWYTSCIQLRVVFDECICIYLYYIYMTYIYIHDTRYYYIFI